VIYRYLGYLLLISILFRIPPLGIAYLYDEPMGGFLFTSAISFVLGIGLVLYSTIKGTKKFTLSSAIILSAAAFIIFSMISAITFLPVFNGNYLDASFETFSGYTTTGFSLIKDLDSIPKSLLFWRAETQLMGGIGIVIIFLFLLSRLRSHHYEPTEGEETSEAGHSLYLSQGFGEKLEPSLRKTTLSILIIYFLYTFAGIILLYFVGMPPLESAMYTFSSISTGGFTHANEFPLEPFQLGVLTLLMIIGALPFTMHHSILKGKFTNFPGEGEARVFGALIIFAMMIGFLLAPTIPTTFDIVSAFTTTGYSTPFISQFPQLLVLLVIGAMLVGGCIGSTAGGLKAIRFLTLLKSVPWMIRKLSRPATAITPFKIEKKTLESEDIVIIQTFASTYIIFLILGVIILTTVGQSLGEAGFHATSALGTVGLSTADLALLHPIGKITLIALMLLGRLEIFPLLVLFSVLSRKFHRRKK